jgi:hypothetical protein
LFIIADWNGYVFNHALNIKEAGAISIAKWHAYTSQARSSSSASAAAKECRHACLC